MKRYQHHTVYYPDLVLSSPRIVLLGGNGSGKSTLLQAMMHLIEYKGTIDTTDALAYMPELPSFPKDTTVEEFLCAFGGYYPDSLVTEFALADKRQTNIASLSKGMKGKLNAIQCLMEEADVYLLDEPSNGMDDPSFDRLYQWLKTTTKHWIVTTHQPQLFDGLEAEVINLDSHS